jgi:hypothetical protein
MLIERLVMHEKMTPGADLTTALSVIVRGRHRRP